jgi:hypothetical protein
MKILPEKIALVLSLVLLAGIAATQLGSALPATAARALQAPLGNNPYTPVVAPTIEATPLDWQSPPSQSAGGDWIFEVFTPPIIYYNPQTASFSLTPPGRTAEVDRPFGVTLRAITRPLFRFQYRGHIGEGRRTIIQIEDTHKKSWIDARIGQTDEESGLHVVDFEAIRELRPSEQDDGAPLLFEDVRLSIRLPGSEEVYTLNREPFYEGQPAAVFATSGGQTRTLRVGESLLDGEQNLRLEAIETNPPQVILVRPASQERPQRREILTPSLQN